MLSPQLADAGDGSDYDEEETQEEPKSKKKGAAASAASRPRRPKSSWIPTSRRPAVARFARLLKGENWKLTTTLTLEYGDGDPLPVWELDGKEIDGVAHYVDFELLYPRLVTSGLLPANPTPATLGVRLKYRADFASAALRLLYYFLDGEPTFEKKLAASDPAARQEYLPLRQNVLMVGKPAVPFVCVGAVIQTLLAHPYLPLAQRHTPADEFNALLTACQPIIDAPLQFPGAAQ